MKPLKRFISYYKPYKTILLFDTLCAIVLSVVDLTFPQILSFLTKGKFLESAENIRSSLPFIALGLLVLYLIRTFCNYYVAAYGHFMGARIESDMRQDLFDHYNRLSFSYYDSHNTGEMMSKLVTDLYELSELAHHGPENLVICTLKIVGSFALLMLINVRMTLILLCLVVVMVIFTAWRQLGMRRAFMDNRKKIAAVNSSLQDSLAGVRVVKSFANENIEESKFRVNNLNFLKSRENSYRAMAIFQSGMSLTQGLLYVAVLVSGGWFIANGSLDPAELAIYALYIAIFLGPIETLLNFTETFQKGFAGFNRFCETVETQPDIKDRPNAMELTNVEGRIKYNDVSFRYESAENTDVLTNLSFDIEPGKTVALVGPSGGGKTTICSLLPRFYDVTGGAITIDGYDIRDLTVKSLRQAIGMVQQDVYLFDGSIGENIAYGRPGASDMEIINAAKDANIHDFIMSLPEGYGTYVGERGVRLSGGQKQRVSIARVFLKNPKILILDEATSSLDTESERHIQASLETLSKDRTTIVIAHRLTTIKNADVIYVIDDSGICEKGAHTELLAIDGLYAKYYNM